MNIATSTYDGFHLMPHEKDENKVQFKFFKINEDHLQGDTIGRTDIGETFNVLLFKHGSGGIELNDTFEAVFADPVVYAKNLIGMDIYGTFVKKTVEAQEWFDDYLKLTIERVTMINNELMEKSDDTI
jgi:hypothetical protein